VNPLTGLHTVLTSGALIAVAAAPGLAATATITQVDITPTAGGLELVLAIDGDSNLFTVSQGNTLQADLTRTQLNLPAGDRFYQANPAPGIAAVTVSPLDAHSVRVTIDGTDSAPVGQVQSVDGGVVLAVTTDGTAATASPTPVPSTLVTVPDPSAVAQAAPDPDEILGDPAEATTPAPDLPAPDVLVPNPDVTIDGVPITQPSLPQAPPFLPRAVPPPVGDIAIAENTIQASSISLGSNERIPKLVLRDAPSREVLALLARAAGLNLVFAGGAAEGGGEEGGGNEGPPITLDIEDESVQDVFNHVLRITGLQANRVGRSIYVGPALPDGARNLVSRTLRLNQAGAETAAGYLASLGATSTQIVTEVSTEQEVLASVVEGATDLVRTTQTERISVEPIDFSGAEDAPIAQPLAGLQAVADPRLNSLTLVGEIALVDLATEYITRLDLRQRQVSINVKIIDITLANQEDLGVSFSYINNGFSFGFGPDQAGFSLGVDTGPGNSGNQFILNIEAAIANNNAKIITDPTLVVQEGSQASVALVEQVLASLETTISPETGDVTSITPVFEEAGLTLNVQVERIDDNGFVTLNVAPVVSAPQQEVIFATAVGQQELTPIARREVNSGSIRVRDGQTLVLAGIIQESELSTITKVPILGDLPIIGALFRDTSVGSERNEVIVLVTPQILDDSDQAVFGYRYTPSEEVQEILENRP